MTFMTHDPLFVKEANIEIPLRQSIEHPILEALELLTHLENEPLPEVAIIDHIWPIYCREAVEHSLKSKHLKKEEERLDNFQHEISEAFSHLKNAFTKN